MPLPPAIGWERGSDGGIPASEWLWPPPKLHQLKSQTARRWLARLAAKSPALAVEGGAVLWVDGGGDHQVNGYYTYRHYFEAGPVATELSNLAGKRPDGLHSYTKRFNQHGELTIDHRTIRPRSPLPPTAFLTAVH